MTHSRRLPFPLTIMALLVSATAALPLGYLVLRAFGSGTTAWPRLWHGQMTTLLGNSVALLLTTIAFTVPLGVGAAWLVERTNLPGRAVWRWLLALPLAIPPYVTAICWVILLRRGGLLDVTAMGVFGLERGALPLPSIYNLGGATLTIGLSVFPYVYLPAAAALRSLDRSLEEAARMSGSSAWATFRRITLPMLLPAVATGALLVGLYALADFGTVGMLRYRTFTTAIYNEFTGQTNRAGAAALSFVLIALTLPLLLGESWLSRRKRRLSRETAWRACRPVALNRWRWPALLAVLTLVLLSLGLPLAVLGGLSLQGLFFPSEADRIWSINNSGLWQYGLHSLVAAGVAATLATVLAIAPALLAARYPRPLTLLLLQASKSTHALPGMIVGLAFVLLLNRWLPPVYGTLAALLIGFTFRLLPQAAGVAEGALRRVSPHHEQAARAMGCRPLTTFGRVTLPIAAPGILAGWALVFITAMKELPLAIMLRPPGYDTLAVRVWSAASESVHTQAAPAAFVLVLITLLALLLMAGVTRTGLDKALRDGS